METEEAELLNLAWKDYQASTVKTFKNLLGDQHFADVTLACGKGQQLKAHKVILSSCSPFLRNILVQNPHQHPIIYLTNVDMEDLESLMKFIYQGEVQIENEGLTKFLETANDLEIDGLFQRHAKMEQKKKEEELAKAKEKEKIAAQKEKEAAALREKEKEREKALIKEKVIQKKRLEEWELEKKGKKRKVTEETKIEEVFPQQHLIMPKASPQKVSKISVDTPKAKEKKQPISWLQFLESQRKPKVEEDTTAYSSQGDIVDVDPDAVHEITAIEDGSDIDDALEVEFPEDANNSEEFCTSPSGTSRHRCDFCPKTFSRRSDCERHTKKYHPVMTEVAIQGENGVESYESYDFGGYNNLNLNATPCDICAKVFTTKWSMQEHRDSVHEGIRFLCDHCDHIASSKRNLRGHMGKKHPDHPLPAQYTSIKADDAGFPMKGKILEPFLSHILCLTELYCRLPTEQ